MSVTELVTTNQGGIAAALELVETGVANRIDGDAWSVYRSGTLIRIDLKGRFNNQKEAS